MDWTEDQKKAIFDKDSNILVAAAAGSGKTAVLVERIIQKILNDNIDIDRLLVVTFTNAAASEMRERVLSAIYKKIDEDPLNERLQRQVILLGKASICTIHSFCLDVIRNNFFELDIPANFRIGNEQEMLLMKSETLEDLFEKLYEEENSDFERLVNMYTDYKSDDSLKELVLDVYKYIQSMPFPNEWLLENIAKYEPSNDNVDFAQSIWGQVIIKNLKEEVLAGIKALKSIRNKLEMVYELEKCKIIIEEDIKTLKGLHDVMDKPWDDIVKYVRLMDFSRWSAPKEDMALKDEAKKVRDSVIPKFKNTGDKSIIRNIFGYESNLLFDDIYDAHEILVLLGKLVIRFGEEFSQNKREKNVIDFNDIEHFALQILVRQGENGQYTSSEVAESYKEKFEEIAIDEYQDSNQVQEFILKVISRGNNVFMVGDVKQSIYKFRQACPRLFLEKYNTFSLDGNDQGKKIQLFKNFRSRKNVLDVTNLVFDNIMSSSLGDNVEYTKEEYLNLGASYDEVSNSLGNAEVDVIEIDSSEDDELKSIEKTEIEAKFIAQKIKELVDNKYTITDKNGLREIQYKDIVILMRATAKTASIFEKELLNNDIPVFSDGTNEYLDTIEIQTIINILRMLDNPLDDIAVVSAMRSVIGGFTDNEILEIRLYNRDCDFFESIEIASNKLDGKLKEKVDTFLNNIKRWKEESDYLSLAELVWTIYSETGFYNYVGLMPNGSLRQANLKMLFEIAKDYEKTSYTGIFNFIRYIERLKTENSDMSAAKIISENENVVRIMSIHKSKGLEFPVVFLATSSKQISFKDLNSKLILHQELGFGMDYVDFENMQEYPIITKEAIKIIAKEEIIAEEMRILYVALTRAKEKLIITGTQKNIEEELTKKSEALHTTNSSKISNALLKKYISFLDWIELIYINNKELIKANNLMTINKIEAADIISSDNEQIEKPKGNMMVHFEDYNSFEELEKIFAWHYEWEEDTVLPIKSTVSKIKEEFSEETKTFSIQDVSFESTQTVEVTGARKGTIMHNVLQNVNFKDLNSEQSIKRIMDDMLEHDIINTSEYSAVNVNKILTFLESNIGKAISNCKVIEKEKPFCIKVDMQSVDEEKKGSMLVQGIIDLYAIDDNDEIILLDYKTDFVTDGQELVQKYKKQLELYKIALEKYYNKKVSKVYIYSLYLDREMCVF
ncbi:MAG: helicase-exonuclease AddAB subunit AddA [Clostridia bacterium]|nr:helicase-exonuclease AddAB subunit AddA [Clostridia bacterium]